MKHAASISARGSTASALQPTGPWAGLPISWTSDEEFDEPAYRETVSKCCIADIPGIYTGGTTGEFYALSFEEFQRITRATVEQCHQHDVPAMIGVTATGTRQVIERAVFAAQCGADAVQLSVPFWIELTDDEVVRFFGDLAAAIGPMAFSIYDTPRAKRTLSLEVHQRVKDVAPGYTMVKSIGGTVGATAEGCAALSQIVNVFVSETKWDTLGPHGAIGSCSAMVYWNPQVALTLWELLQRQDWEGLEQGLLPVQHLHEFLFKQFGPRGFSDGAYDRVMAAATGFVSVGLTCRSPYNSPTEKDVAVARDWLKLHMHNLLADSTCSA